MHQFVQRVGSYEWRCTGVLLVAYGSASSVLRSVVMRLGRTKYGP